MTVCSAYVEPPFGTVSDSEALLGDCYSGYMFCSGWLVCDSRRSILRISVRMYRLSVSFFCGLACSSHDNLMTAVVDEWRDCQFV